MVTLRRAFTFLAAITAIPSLNINASDGTQWTLYATGGAAIGCITSGIIGYHVGRHTHEGEYWSNLQQRTQSMYGYHPCANMVQDIAATSSELTTHDARNIYYCLQRNRGASVYDMLTQVDRHITDIASARTAAEHTSQAHDTAHQDTLRRAQDRQHTLEQSRNMLHRNASALDAYFHIYGSVFTRDTRVFQDIMRPNISQAERQTQLSTLLQRYYGYHPLHMAYAYDDIRQLLDTLYTDRDAIARAENTSFTAQVHEHIEHCIQILEDLYSMLEHDTTCCQQRQFLQHHNEYVRATQQQSTTTQKQYEDIKDLLHKDIEEEKRIANWYRAKNITRAFGLILGAQQQRSQDASRDTTPTHSHEDKTPQTKKPTHNQHTPTDETTTPSTYNPEEHPDAYPPSAPPQEDA